MVRSIFICKSSWGAYTPFVELQLTRPTPFQESAHHLSASTAEQTLEFLKIMGPSQSKATKQTLMLRHIGMET